MISILRQGGFGAGAGEKGDTGAGGEKGDTGIQGLAGDTGSGAKGDTGIAGSKGDTGTTGSRGDTGISGEKGDTGVGAGGDTGTAGAKGDTGVQGSQGDTGVGEKGDTGTAGTKGDTGATGDQGDTGVQGTQGDTGTGTTGSYFVAQHSADQACGTSLADISFNTNVENAGSDISHSEGTNPDRFSIATTGVYLISVFLMSDTVDNNAIVGMDIRVDDSTILEGSERYQNTSSAAGNSVQGTWVGTLTSGTYITVRAYKSSAGENWNAGEQNIYIVRLA